MMSTSVSGGSTSHVKNAAGSGLSGGGCLSLRLLCSTVFPVFVSISVDASTPPATCPVIQCVASLTLQP